MKNSSPAQFDLQRTLSDFQNLNPKDIGAWPDAPRFTALFGVFILVLFLGGYIFLLDQQTSLEIMQVEELSLRDDFINKKKQAVNLDLYTAQLGEIDRSFGALLKQLPNKAEVEALLIEINQSGMGRGLKFDLFKPNATLNKDFYAELPVNLRLMGTYNDLGAFAEDIAKLPRIVTLNNISITPVAQDKGDGLVMEAVIRTFRYLDPDELAAQKKAAEGKK